MTTAIHVPKRTLLVPRLVSYDEIIRREIANGVHFGPFWRGRQLARAPEAVKRYLRQAKRHPGFMAVRQGFTGMDVSDASPASFAAVGGTSTAEANLWTLPAVWSGIPAGDMRAGKVYRVECGGITSTVTTPTVVWTGRVGTSATPASNISLGGSTAVASGSGLAAVPFYAKLTMVVRALGIAAAGATCAGHGMAVLGNAAAAAAQVAVFGGTVPTNIDQTIGQGLMISITFGTSNAGNTFTTQWVAMRSMN